MDRKRSRIYGLALGVCLVLFLVVIGGLSQYERFDTRKLAGTASEGTVGPGPATTSTSDGSETKGTKGSGEDGLKVDQPPATPFDLSRLPPESPAVQAGWADDNQSFHGYLHFLRRHEDKRWPVARLSERIVVRVTDSAGRPVSNCRLTFHSGAGTRLCERLTYADGCAMVFPEEYRLGEQETLSIVAEYAGRRVEKQTAVAGPRRVDLRLPVSRRAYQAVPLDIAFVADTTGSMRPQINRLKETLEVIHYQTVNCEPRPDVRFGMVEFRDRGDTYLTRPTDFTPDAEAFRKRLATVSVGGGGDTEEDLQAALETALKRLDWREDAIRLVFVVSDAAPHTDYEDQTFTYLKAMQTAAERGIKITTIGVPPLPVKGEFVFRQLAQYTRGIYVFLTFGETGDSEGGTATSVSHHVGANWQAENLDAIIVKMIRRELAHLGNVQVPVRDYWQAKPHARLPNKRVLAQLFTGASRQLLDYCPLEIQQGTPTAVLPVRVQPAGLEKHADRLGDHLVFALQRRKIFRILDRRDSEIIKDELARAAGPLIDASEAPRIGRLLGASLLVDSRVRSSESGLEMTVKLLRVETGELLSIALLRVDRGLLQ